MPTIRAWFLTALAAAAAVLPARAQPLPNEYTIKAVFLYRFTGFVRWPTSAFAAPDTPFVIGILGADPFGGALAEVVKGESVQGHPIVVRQIANAEQAQACQIVFVARGAEPVLKSRKLAALSVGETDAFLASGGIIRFLTEHNHVRLQINLQAAQQAGLTISSRLLRVAQVIGGT